MICQDCKFYLEVNTNYCGLGYSCKTQNEEKECKAKVIGTPELVEVILVEPWQYLTDKRLEQCPKIVKEMLKEKLIFYKRTHVRKKNKRTVRIIIGVIKDSLNYSNASKLISLIRPNKNNTSWDINNNHKLKVTEIVIKWEESIRESFILKKQKQGKKIV